MTCQHFYGVDQHCHTMMGCNLRQRQLQQDRHLKKRCKLRAPSWQKEIGWAPKAGGGHNLVMKKLLPIALLLGSLVTPAGASTYSESFDYEAGYKACVRSYFTGMPRDDWNSKSKLEKDHFRAWVHQGCK